MPVNEFMGYTLTTDECEALYDYFTKMREKNEQKRLRQSCKNAISILIEDAINTIGLDETKRIVRELNRELRENTID